MDRDHAIEVQVRRAAGAGGDRPLPRYESDGAAGMDLLAAVDEPIRLEPGERRRVPTGIAIALPSPRFVAFVFARSGLAGKYGVVLANGVGVIDSDYRGEILCALHNQGDEPFVIEPGDRIAQLVVTPVLRVRWRETDRLPPTARGDGGFGSTGR